MSKVRANKGPMTVVAYRGDAKTLLAFDLQSESAREGLAGFTVQIAPPGVTPYFLQNNLRYERPGDHAQDPQEPSFSTINSPIHKFRWVHVPGTVHQGLKPVYGKYTYTVTPRYFDANGSMLALDKSKSVSVEIDVAPFKTGNLALGFTRGFTQSQAFVRHFGLKTPIRPKDAELQFDTKQLAGTNATGDRFSFADQYEWLGFTARTQIFDLLNAVKANAALKVDIFAYDLNEPDLVGLLLALGKAKQARIILDNAALHHSAAKPKAEDEFEKLFANAAGAGAIKRGHFGRYSHDKIFIVRDQNGPVRVLTGSTNFSVTGLYVNSNHVLVFDDSTVAKKYAEVFEEAWNDNVQAADFVRSSLATQIFQLGGAGGVPQMEVAFSPHEPAFARQVLDGIVSRVQKEAKVADGKGSVLFAVMELDGGPDNPVYDALNALHKESTVFSYGISDNPDGIALYPVGAKTGVLVTGKPVNTQLPPPFNQVPNIGGIGHQVHHKFIVCGFNGADPTVFCGSSNLALGGEKVNGDNLLTIRDEDVAAAFAIEALALVDHFNFLDSVAKGPKAVAASAKHAPPAVKQQAAVSAGWFLGTSDAWAHKYFDPHELHSTDRELFAG
jgi:phosphatidylserine/phosphatidylglycerophosphate/cardiolipin synthase-like enzyme